MGSTENNKDQKHIAYLSGSVSAAGTLHWQLFDHVIRDEDEEEEGLHINFHFIGSLKEKQAVKIINTALHDNEVSWIRENKNKWVVDVDKLYEEIPSLYRHEWLKGVVQPQLKIDQRERTVFDKQQKETIVIFSITREILEHSMPKKIFLSHKGTNKPIVEDYYNVLREIGFTPWFDKDALVAGVPLERGLLNGMKESCAAVFFITPDFKDENYLATEIDYAIAEKREKKDKFAIITLVLPGEDGKKGSVPELLKRFVWKEPDNNIQALHEILRSLPIETDTIVWKDTLNKLGL